MPGIILGKHFNIGGREVYEDRVAASEVMTAGGLNLAVAMVADGVGGQDKGERASQLAIDSALRYIRNSSDVDVPTLLGKALRYANQQVYEEAQRLNYEGMCTTGVVAVIHNQKNLYIANVGDSRIYLWRNNRLTRLTLDHTYATSLIQKQGMDPLEAEQHPRGHVVTRALGLQENVQVDVGIYVNTYDTDVAYDRGCQGLSLKEGDSILVCSDGLIKLSPRTGKPLVTEEEIVTVLGQEEGDKAARTLIAFALGRDPDDNISVGLLQMPDPKRLGRRTRKQLLMQGGIAAAILVLIAGLVFAVSRVFQTSGELNSVAAQATRAAFEETARAETVAAFTPTPIPPTATLRPPIIPGEIAALFMNDARSPVKLGDVLTIDSNPGLVVVNHRTDLVDGNDGRIYSLPLSTLAFDSVTDDHFSMTASQNSQVFVQTGRYSGGAQFRLEPSGVVLAVRGSCLAFNLADRADPTIVAATCYHGVCSYVLRFGDSPTTLGEGQTVILDLEELRAVETGPVTVSEAIGHAAMLREFSDSGRSDIQQCVQSYLPALPGASPGALTELPPPGTGEPGTTPSTGEPGGNTEPQPTPAPGSPSDPVATSTSSAPSDPAPTATSSSGSPSNKPTDNPGADPGNRPTKSPN